MTKARSGTGLLTIDGSRAAFGRIPTTTGNANDWLVAAVVRGTTAGALVGVPLSAYLLVVIALLLVVLSAVLRSRAERELELETLTDSLTGLRNRRALIAQLPRRIGGPRSLLVILDLDGFKSYNDTFGHPAGDALLCRLALRLTKALPPSALAYRIGGDEFCVRLPDRLADARRRRTPLDARDGRARRGLQRELLLRLGR